MKVLVLFALFFGLEVDAENVYSPIVSQKRNLASGGEPKTVVLPFPGTATKATTTTTLQLDPKNESNLEASDGECESCGGSFIREVEELQETVTEECPSNVHHLRRLMAVSFESCDAANQIHPGYDPENPYGTYLKGYLRGDAECKFSERGSVCREIVSLRGKGLNKGIRDTNIFNGQRKTCDSGRRCRYSDVNNIVSDPSGEREDRHFSGKDRCTSLFYMLSGTYESDSSGRLVDRFPYNPGSQRNGKVDPFNVLNRDSGGNEFVGWSCSEYITTGMGLAGYNFERNKPITKSNQQYNSHAMRRLARSSSSNSCVDDVDLSRGGKIKAGDILAFDGHTMMVESAAKDFFGRLTDPKSLNECREENIHYSDLKLLVNQSSDTMGAPTRIGMGDYLYFGYRTDVKYALFDEYSAQVERSLTSIEGLSESKKERIMTDAYYFRDLTKEKLQSYGLTEIQAVQLSGVANPSHRRLNQEANRLRVKMGDAKSTLDLERRYLEQNSSGWQRWRNYMQTYCEAEFYRKTGNATLAKKSAEDLRAMNFFTVVRHEANIDKEKAKERGCYQPERASGLAHSSCYENCDKELKQCPKL